MVHRAAGFVQPKLDRTGKQARAASGVPATFKKAGVRRSYKKPRLFGNSVPGHATRAPPACKRNRR